MWGLIHISGHYYGTLINARAVEREENAGITNAIVSRHLLSCRIAFCCQLTEDLKCLGEIAVQGITKLQRKEVRGIHYEYQQKSLYT